MAGNESSVRVEKVSVERFPEFDQHKEVVYIHDEHTGLRGYISLHNTNLGPAIGGTRYWQYTSDDEGLKDALRLSRAMTYKCAIAGVPFGGGKAVLLSSGKDQEKSENYLVAYTTALAQLKEKFFTGEDVGLNQHDVEVLEAHSDTIVGRPKVGGLPAQWAALSVFSTMQTALESVFGSDSFEGKTVSVKGLGGVGLDLCSLLTDAGAHIVGADIKPDRVQLLKSKFPNMEIVAHDVIHEVPTDVYSPCALNDEFNPVTIPKLKTKIICGGANNQLRSASDGRSLFDAGILYVPDYLANAGGLISVADELNPGGYSRDRVLSLISDLKVTLAEIIEMSHNQSMPTGEVSDLIAERRFNAQ